MKFGKVVAWTVASAAMLGSAAASSAEWKGYTYIDSVTTPAYKGLVKFSEAVKAATNGSVTVRVNVGGSLPIKSNNITQAVADGVLTMGDDLMFVGNIPVGGLLRLPFLVKDEEEYAKASKVYLPYVEKALKERGITLLGQYHYPIQVLFTSSAVTSLGDFAGKKIRVTSPEQGAFIKAVSGIPVTMGPPEVPPGLERHVIDGVLTASAGGGLVWRDFFTHSYRIGVNWTNGLYIVNSATFEKLSAEEQAAVRKAAVEATSWIESFLRESEKTATQKFQDTGMIVTYPTDAESAKATELMTSFWGEWAAAKGPETVEALKKVREVLGK